jgi:hypothetical protein
VKGTERLRLAVISPDFTAGLVVFVLFWVAAARADARKMRKPSRLSVPAPDSVPGA